MFRTPVADLTTLGSTCAGGGDAGSLFEFPLGRDAQRLQAGMPALLVRRAAGILRNVQKERTIEEFDREVAFGFREIRAMDCCRRAAD